MAILQQNIPPSSGEEARESQSRKFYLELLARPLLRIRYGRKSGKARNAALGIPSPLNSSQDNMSI